MRLISSSPLMPGIDRSTMAMPIGCRRRHSSAWKPLPASVICHGSPAVSRMRRSPSRTMVWSSTSSRPSRCCASGSSCLVLGGSRRRRAGAAVGGSRGARGGRSGSASARSGRRTVTRPPPLGELPICQLAAEHQGALADAHQAVRAFAVHRGLVEADAVVQHRRAAASPPLCCTSMHTFGGPGVARDVGQRLLHHAVQRDAAPRRRWPGRRHPGAASRRRPCGATSRRPAIRWPRSGPGRRASAAAVRWRCAAPWPRCRRPSRASRRCGRPARAPAASPPQAGQLHLQRGQPLAQFVVQLARDAPALVLARLHHAAPTGCAAGAASAPVRGSRARAR